MPVRTRHFWGWQAPVLDQAVAFLRGDRPAGAVWDLSDRLLIVPTTEAGRRLKEALARAAAPAGVLVPWVWTPEQALLPAAGRLAAASALQAQMAWQRALQQVPPEELPALFPALPAERGWPWQQDTARLLAELKSLLGAAGLRFADLPARMPGDAARWRDLARLEAAFTEALEQAGLADAQALKLACARAPRLPEGVRRVQVLAAPDLPPLFTHWAEACELDLTVAVHAPPALADRFDALGRPLPEYWGEDAAQVIPLAEPAIHLCRDVGLQSDRVVELLRELAPQARVAVGMGDPEVGEVLEEKLMIEGVRLFQPGGLAVREVGLWHILQQVRQLSAGSWRPLAALLRVPEACAALTGGAGQSGVLKAADILAAEHMPVTLDHALELLERAQLGPSQATLRQALETARQWLRDLRSRPLDEFARALLLRLYGDREFAAEAPDDQLTTALGEAWLQICGEIGAELARFGLGPQPDEALAWSLHALETVSLSEPRGEVDLVLQGWLELLWESAPNLIVAGLNEEYVPGILIAHPFLPDSLRQQLGLPSQASRFARDAYLLRALAEQRAGCGQLRVLCGQWSERGDALRPSRLLFLCPDAELPQRVAHLFPAGEGGAAAIPEPPRTLAWPLRPQLQPSRCDHISPSRIRSYLQCPFRDYLSSELRMRAVDPAKRELAAVEFGNLAHHAFQQLAQEPALDGAADADTLADFLIQAALGRAEQLYGRRPAPLIQLQLESLKQRLRHAAETEAEQRRLGWRIYRAEWRLGGAGDEQPLVIAGLPLRCTIDRVDRHEATGRLRVLDFKTSDKASEPRAAHALKVSGRRQVAEAEQWKGFVLADGSGYLWQDLQLPLYAAALAHRGLKPDELGYFTLPKSVQDTKILLWEDFDDEWLEQALACAAEVVRRLQEGRFWPPADKARNGDFEALFLGDVRAAVAV